MKILMKYHGRHGMPMTAVFWQDAGHSVAPQMQPRRPPSSCSFCGLAPIIHLQNGDAIVYQYPLAHRARGMKSPAAQFYPAWQAGKRVQIVGMRGNAKALVP